MSTDLIDMIRKKILPDGLFAVLVLLVGYLYQRSFGIMFDKLPEAIGEQQEQTQLSLSNFIGGLEFSYLTMSVLWPIVLSFLYYTYRRYPGLKNNGVISKAIFENFDLRLMFSFIVIGVLFLHTIVCTFIVVDAFELLFNLQRFG